MIADLEEDMTGTSIKAKPKMDEVSLAHALEEQRERVERYKSVSRVPELQVFPGFKSQLLVKDFGMYTLEGNEAVTKLMRYIEDMMRRQLWTDHIKEAINLGLRYIAKQGHTEVYDRWVLDEMEKLIDAMVEDFIEEGTDAYHQFYDEPTVIDIPEESELEPFRRATSDEELYQLPVP